MKIAAGYIITNKEVGTAIHGTERPHMEPSLCFMTMDLISIIEYLHGFLSDANRFVLATVAGALETIFNLQFTWKDPSHCQNQNQNSLCCFHLKTSQICLSSSVVKSPRMTVALVLLPLFQYCDEILR